MASAKFNTKDLFEAFSRYGSTKSNGDVITLKQVERWMTQAGILDNKMLSSADTSLIYTKMKSPKGLTFEKFMIYVDMLAASKNLDARVLKAKLEESGLPGSNANTEDAFENERNTVEAFIENIMMKVNMLQQQSLIRISSPASEITKLCHELLSESEHAIHKAGNEAQNKIEDFESNKMGTMGSEMLTLHTVIKEGLQEIRSFVAAKEKLVSEIEDDIALHVEIFSDSVLDSIGTLDSCIGKSVQVQRMCLAREENLLMSKISKYSAELEKFVNKAVADLIHIKLDLNIESRNIIKKSVNAITEFSQRLPQV